MNLPDFERHAQEWIAAWNEHDLEQILKHYADDVEFHSPFASKLTGRSSGTIQGKAALRDYFKRALDAYPTLHFEFLCLYAGVRSYVLEYRSVNNLIAAEVLEFNPSGKIQKVLAHYHDEAQ